MNTPQIGESEFVLIRYPRFNELHDEIRRCRELSRMSGEALCMVLKGMTGAGKSTVVKAYAGQAARYETAGGTKIPIFYVGVPSPVTVKGLASAMLEKLGDPLAEKGTLWAMNARLIRYLRACEVKLVIVDDVHHLIDKETNRVIEQVSDWLKVLIKEGGIPFLIVGTEGKVEEILQTNSQLKRLVAIKATLRPFPWDPNQPETIKDFGRFVKYAVESVSLPLSEEVPAAEMLYRLHYATDGVIGEIMILIRTAAILAREEGREVLTLPLLSAAFQKREGDGPPRKINPFDAPAGSSFVAPPEPPEGGTARKK
ncbi:MAG: TniB family NTP-binding protein [Chloroflexi bacterium]|nr:TniB family NTP-binding protein [Chloroflexota bacterium]MCI0575931.1 TniB family NTP-binding protein [Chloroflexota bacterium]MCI0730055.1 TniB family NTP-binding protein [Chloroflexota bacterium]